MPSPPDSLTPFVAAGTLVALGMSFVMSGHIKDSDQELAFPRDTKSCILHIPTEAPTSQVIVASLQRNNCAGEASLYFDGSSQTSIPDSTTAEPVWFMRPLTTGVHPFLVSIKTSTGTTHVLRGNVVAKQSVGLTDLSTTASSIFGGLAAVAGLIAAVAAVFKRAS